MPEQARIVRPAERATEVSSAAGLQTLQLKHGTEAFIYVPRPCAKEASCPLVIYLHGAGGRAEDSLLFARMVADHYKFVAICPSSTSYTWDVIANKRYGPDVESIQQCVDFAARDYKIDWERVCLAGFSDGGTYALSLGLTNGDVFSHVLAFSPGYCAPARRHGEPKTLICHGRNDKVLPIDRCSRRIVPELREEGYNVEYVEFTGGHILRPDLLHTGLSWFLGGRVDDQVRAD